MPRVLLETSITVLIFRCVCRWYVCLEQKASCIYRDSQIYRMTKVFREKIKVCFRYSFLGRITEIKEANPALLDNSRVVQYLINFYKRWRDKVTHYSKASSIVSLARDTKEQVIFCPVKIISIITVTTILVNAALSVILQKQIDLWSFLIQVLFLFAGTVGLSCEAGWSTVKESSVFLRKMCQD